ncbi:MAG: YaiI/YqxD family protein [Legionellales bacterium]|nr:YaiI/YqxD family protein [Legionellales bacterium]
MKIWIDGDACPKVIKQILFRAAMKRSVPLCIVANHIAITPPSLFIKRILVEAGFDAADTYIVAHLEKNDLVITADTILADLVIDKEAIALNPRGTLYSVNNIKQVVTMRNLNEALRSTGLIRGGLSQLSAKEVQSFSNHLDRIITQFHR